MKFNPEQVRREKNENFEKAWIESGKYIKKNALEESYPRLKPVFGKPHPVYETIQKLREAYMRMGFAEYMNPLIVEERDIYKQFGDEAPAVLDRCFYLAGLPRPNVGISDERINLINKILINGKGVYDVLFTKDDMMRTKLVEHLNTYDFPISAPSNPFDSLFINNNLFNFLRTDEDFYNILIQKVSNNNILLVLERYHQVNVFSNILKNLTLTSMGDHNLSNDAQSHLVSLYTSIAGLESDSFDEEKTLKYLEYAISTLNVGNNLSLNQIQILLQNSSLLTFKLLLSLKEIQNQIIHSDIFEKLFENDNSC